MPAAGILKKVAVLIDADTQRRDVDRVRRERQVDVAVQQTQDLAGRNRRLFREDPLELAVVRARLAAAGLVVVEADRLAELERAAAALQRMRRLAVGDDDPVS